jgi:hypothetical protein
MSATPANRSIPEIFSDLIGQLTTLLKKEGQLARTEVSEKIAQVATGLGYAVVGAVLAMPALVILLQAVVALLVQGGFSFALSAVIVGGVTLVIGIILLIAGVNRLKGENLVPNKTIHQLQRDAEVVAHEVRNENDLNRAA